jgi:hypothetical protein
VSLVEKINGAYSRFFEVEEDKSAEAELVTHSDVLDWAGRAYHAKFMEYLENGFNRPVKVGEPMDMVQAAVRANTFREIREHIQKLVKYAEAGLQHARKERDV